MVNPVNTPAGVFESVLDALRVCDWQRAVAQCDPDSLTLFKERLVAKYSSDGSTMTAAEYMRADPEMPLVVAEYFAQSAVTLRARSNVLDRELPGISTYPELLAASAQTVFAAWLHGRSTRTQMDRVMSQHRMLPSIAALAGVSFEYRLTVLGTVMDDDKWAHVVYRDDWVERGDDTTEPTSDDRDLMAQLTTGALHGRSPAIATCRRQVDGAWQMLATTAFPSDGRGVWTIEASTSESIATGQAPGVWFKLTRS